MGKKLDEEIEHLKQTTHPIRAPARSRIPKYTDLNDSKARRNVRVQEALDGLERVRLRNADLFDDPENIISGLKHFRYRGHEVIVFHTLDPQELMLDFKQHTRFRDMETGEEIITQPWHIQKDYQNNMKSYCDYFKSNFSK